MKLRALRESLGLSQEQMALVLGGYTWASVSRWELGKSQYPPEILVMMSRVETLRDRITWLMAPHDLGGFLLTPSMSMRNFPPYDLLRSNFAFLHLLDMVAAAKANQATAAL